MSKEKNTNKDNFLFKDNKSIKELFENIPEKFYQNFSLIVLEEEYKQIGTDRMRWWLGSIELIKENPVVGCGPENTLEGSKNEDEQIGKN